MLAQVQPIVTVCRLRTIPLLHIRASLGTRTTLPHALTSAVWGVVAGGPVGQTRFGLGGGHSSCSLLPSCSLCVVLVANVFVSCHLLPGLDLRCRPAAPWQVSGRHIRVPSNRRELLHWAQQARGVRCPAAASAVQGPVCYPCPN